MSQLKSQKNIMSIILLKQKFFFDTCFKNNLKKVVFSSTASVYGNPKNKIVNENDELKPINPYALSKYNLENI